MKQIRDRLLRPPFTINILYSGSPVFYVTPNLSNLKISKFANGPWKTLGKIDYTYDIFSEPITHVYPTSYDTNGNAYWNNRAIGKIIFDKKTSDVTVFGFCLVGKKDLATKLVDLCGNTNFRTENMIYAGMKTTHIGGGSFLFTKITEAEKPIYMDASLKSTADREPKPLLGFAFGALPTNMITTTFSPLLLDTWKVGVKKKCICSTTTIVQAGCQCGGC